MNLPPATFADSLLGTFIINGKTARFEAQAVWQGLPVVLSLESSTLKAPTQSDIDISLAFAYILWKAQTEWQQRIEAFGAEQMLSMINNEWLDVEAGETVITADDFKARITLEAISISPENAFVFTYDDGDLFCGHTILIGGDFANGPTNASIYG